MHIIHVYNECESPYGWCWCRCVYGIYLPRALADIVVLSAKYYDICTCLCHTNTIDIM